MQPLTPDAIRVLICGSRTWQEGGPVQAILRQYQAAGPVVLIHGAAQGADSVADYHARRLGIEVFPFPAKWSEHDENWCPGEWCRSSGKNYCVAAGPRRNQQMLDEAVPHVAWAFIDKPMGLLKGTPDMLDRARTRGVPSYVVESINYG